MIINKIDNKPWFLVKLGIFALVLASARACMVPIDIYLELLITLSCFLYMQSRGMFIWKKGQGDAAILICIMSVYTMHGSSSLTAYSGMFVAVLMPALLIGLKANIKMELFDDFSNWLALLLILSIIFWGLHVLGLSLPHINQVIEKDGTSHSIIIENYFFFRTAMYEDSFDQLVFQRFNGFFLEPGHMGTIVFFFLYANGFDMKKRRNIVYLVTILLTLSAAAYTIAAVGYFLHKIGSGSSKIIVKSLFVIVLCIICILLYNNGDNIVNDLIFGKLTREQGALDGRISFEVQELYQKLWDNGDYVFGLGYKTFQDSAGFKVFFVMNGIVGVLLVMISYFKIYLTSPSKYAFYMFILYMINFTQRTYCGWDAFLVPFILGIVYLNNCKRDKVSILRL
jgi:hypothetical protein